MSKNTRKTGKSQAITGSAVYQLPLNKQELLQTMQKSVFSFAAELGKVIITEFLEEDVNNLCGERYGRNGSCYRHGSQSGSVLIGGAKQKVVKPRVRNRDGKEVALPRYEMLQGRELLSENCMNKMVLGVSTRNYSEVIDAATTSFGVCKSSVSKQFIKGSKKALEQLQNRSFADNQMVVIMIDGIEFAGEVVVTAVGIDSDGHKHVLGLRQGATEHAEVVGSLLSDLVEQGVDSSRPTLFVIDGSKALNKAIQTFWGKNALIQRCTIHKRRNILAHLTEEHKEQAGKLYDNALAQPSEEEARKSLRKLSKYLERVSPSAAKSLDEAGDHLLTIHVLNLPELLRKSLVSTNIIESAFSVARSTCRNVKRWRDGEMRLRWASAGLLHAESRFKRINGFKEMSLLIERIARQVNNNKGVDESQQAA